MRPTSGTAYHGGTSAALAPGVRATRRKDRHDPPSPRDAGLVVGYLVPLHWTGFGGHQLWDWLTLLLLPVTLITVQTWSSTTRTVRLHHRVAIGALGVAWILTVIGGYAWAWTWTGYQGNTLWDWLQLLLLPLVFPTILAPALLRFVAGDVENAEQDAERQVEADRAPLQVRPRTAGMGPGRP